MACLMRYDQKKRDPFYATDAWKRLRQMALQRDHYLCQRCKRRPANTVHHLMPRDMFPEKALDLDNLQSVCPRCHNQIHDEKGRKEQPAAAMPERLRVVTIL